MDKSYGKIAGADVILELHLSVGVIYAVFKVVEILPDFYWNFKSEVIAACLIAKT